VEDNFLILAANFGQFAGDKQDFWFGIKEKEVVSISANTN